jgi:hypothetical protein
LKLSVITYASSISEHAGGRNQKPDATVTPHTSVETELCEGFGRAGLSWGIQARVCSGSKIESGPKVTWTLFPHMGQCGGLIRVSSGGQILSLLCGKV